MTDNNKPEWFEIAEKDQPSVPRKASKTLPLAAVLAATLIIGVGAVVAQVQEKSPAVAVETASVQTSASNNTASPTTAASNAKPSPVVRIANPSASSAVATTTGLQNPSIAKLPTKSGDDDDENEGRSRNGNHGEDDDDEGDDD
jgi:hypothetical protein